MKPPAVMTFQSILTEEPDLNQAGKTVEPPVFFSDLNLGRVIDAITAGWEDYDLKPFYFVRLNDLSAIAYRQEIFGDLEGADVLRGIKSFSERMRAMRMRLKQADDAKRLEYKYAMERLFLGAVEIYSEAVESLSRDLSAVDLKSRGLRALRDYLAEYSAGAAFHGLATEAEKLKGDFAAVKYCLLLKDGSVTVRDDNEEDDYSTAIETIFEKFRHDPSNRYRLEVRNWEGMNHIEGQIQDRVALLYPELYQALDAFCAAHATYVDEKIARLDREIQFYVAYLAYMEKFRRARLKFCYPQLSLTCKEIGVQEGFDIALADKLIGEKTAVVVNDFHLSGGERILVVSGPNQGGKTTFARMIGQLHYLGSLGCPIPGSEGRLFLFRRLFTHFERQEQITNLRGKLQDDLVRIHRILGEATPDSLVIMNEMFSSTTLKDALYLSKKVMARISALDLIGVWVTFLDELSSLNEKTVSIVSRVDPASPAIRTYKLERRPADGLAYALAIAQKYRVTYDCLKERMKA